MIKPRVRNFVIALLLGATVVAVAIVALRENVAGQRSDWDKAILSHDATNIQRLLESGQDPNGELDASMNEPDQRARTSPLMWAARHSRWDIADLLLRHGADAEYSDTDGRTALFWAVKTTAPAAIRMLLDHGARVDVTWLRQVTPLSLAARKSDEIVKMLLDAGSDPNISELDGASPLHCACANGRLEAARHLMAAGADIHAEDRKGFTPLVAAAMSSSAHIVDLLVENGVDPDRFDSKHRINPLLAASGSGSLGGVRALLKAGADPNVVGYRGETPLHVTARHGSNEVAIELLLAGADRKAVDADGRTALDIAIARGDAQSLKIARTLSTE